MQGQKDIEEDFEQRWDALKPNPSTRQTTVSHSSFPILDQFADDALRHEIDEVLTVTETSKGLSFEYVWEAGRHDHYEGSHNHSGMDTTLNYHSMFFPASSEDIQAHFPDSAAGTVGMEGGHTPSVLPGIVPVFDAQKPSNRNEYYIQLEEQGESAVGADGNIRPNIDLHSAQQDFVVLQDVHLDESSTDADFFHQSIDSKDSYLPDSHIWSSLENDSPYHTNIFTEGESKPDDSPSWRQNFMELPERNGNPFYESVSQDADKDKLCGNSFLGVCSEATHLSDSVKVEREDADVMRFLSTEKLSDNFMFLKEHNLMKEESVFSNSQQNFLSPGLTHEPEERFKMSSWDNLETFGSLNTADTYSKCAVSGTPPRQEPLDFPSVSLVEFHESLVENDDTLVPSINVITEENISNKSLVQNSSSTEYFGLQQSSEKGIDSGFDSTSERFDVVIGQTDDHSPAFSESATTDSLCTDAKIPSLEEDFETSKDRSQLVGCETTEQPDVQALISPSEDLTSHDLMSELLDDADIELETTLSDQDEPFTDTHGQAPVRSSLLVSGPSLDQISQDSLLEDSMSPTLPTVENSAETPDSLDSLDIDRLGEQVVDLTSEVAQDKLQPPYKISDSGYETENMESPEWNFQPSVTVHSPVKNGLDVAEGEKEDSTLATNLVPPEIVISEVEGVINNQSESRSEDQQPDPVAPAEEPHSGSSYRDSAYFSDNESEPEKKCEEPAQGSASTTWSSNTKDEDNVTTGSPPLEVNEEDDEEVSHQMVSGEQPELQIEEVLLKMDSDGKSEEEETNGQSEEENKSDLFKEVSTGQSVSLEDSDTASPPPSATQSKPENTVHAKLTRTYASDGHKKKEPDIEGRYLGKQDSLGRDVQEDHMDADEEDENSDDSEEDDVRAYQLHSTSSDSEDDTVHTVPLIISDESDSKNLRSLLKPTSLNFQASTAPVPVKFNADNSRRAVSFFDDVTVYLFDQVKSNLGLGLELCFFHLLRLSLLITYNVLSCRRLLPRN